MAAVASVKPDPDAQQDNSNDGSVTTESTPRSLPPLPQLVRSRELRLSDLQFRCPFYGLCEMQPTHDYAQIAVHLEQKLCFAACQHCSQPIRLHDAGSHRCPDQQTTQRTKCPGPGCNEQFTRPNSASDLDSLTDLRQTLLRISIDRGRPSAAQPLSRVVAGSNAHAAKESSMAS